MKSLKSTFFKGISAMVIVFAMVCTTNLNAQGPPGGPTDTDDTLSTNENDLDILNIFVLNRSKELIVSGQLRENTLLDEYYELQNSWPKTLSKGLQHALNVLQHLRPGTQKPCTFGLFYSNNREYGM